MLDQNKLNQLWWAGYCDATVSHAKNTARGDAGRLMRLSWLVSHMPTCEECQIANKFKGMEEKVAAAIGRHQDFVDGTDLRGAPGWTDAVGAAIQAAVASGRLSKFDLFWVAQVAGRHGTPWQESKDA